MFVINSDDKIEYVAASPEVVKSELDSLFHDIDLLLQTDLNPLEKNYYKRRKDYYSNIRKIGLEYEDLDYSKCLEIHSAQIKIYTVEITLQAPYRLMSFQYT